MSSDPGSTTCTFLLVPREIRDEIYRLLLIEPPNPPYPYHPVFHFPTDYNPISVPISIFVLNKQIHTEASEIFYKETTFAIKLQTEEWVTKASSQPWFRRSAADNQDNINAVFYVRYSAPWETFAWKHKRPLPGPVIKLKRRGWSYNPPEDPPQPMTRKLAPLQLPDPPFPSPRYRHLIRRIRLELYDTRLHPSWRTSKPGETHPDSDPRMILVPFMRRLQKLIGTEEKKPEEEKNTQAHLDIKVYTSLCGVRLNERRIIPDEAARINSIRTHTTAEQYKQLVETVYPLTQGGWDYTLTIPPELESIFPGFKEQILEDCKGREVNDWECEDVVLPFKYEWGVARDGRLRL
ncbi:hypothetical protein AA313_de0205815 [Arthrobotrys entomopaga]|nr:hypothetical protein AA313_de0205815 [Arthrobotrys entomopaga]